MLHALSFLVLASCVPASSATGATRANQSREYLLERIKQSRPLDADHELDCMWRKLAMRYAAQLQPWLDKEHISALLDATELSSLCPQVEVDKALFANAPEHVTESMWIRSRQTDRQPDNRSHFGSSRSHFGSSLKFFFCVCVTYLAMPEPHLALAEAFVQTVIPRRANCREVDCRTARHRKTDNLESRLPQLR